MSARIMIVDDETMITKSTAALLMGLGYAVPVVAHSGEDAVRLAMEAKPDLVLMDIGLGWGIDGVEAAALIRASSDIPVIFITGQDDQTTRERATAIGPVGYVVKPFSTVELYSLIQRALENQHMSSQTALAAAW